MTNGVFTEAQVIAAMQAVEAETIVRCEAVAAAYARHAGKKAQSRIAAARAKAAQEIAAEIRKLPRKPVGGGRMNEIAPAVRRGRIYRIEGGNCVVAVNADLDDRLRERIRSALGELLPMARVVMVVSPASELTVTYPE